MRTALTLLLLGLMLPVVQAADAWRTVDAAGNVEYSDNPGPGAVRIALPEPKPIAPVVPPIDLSGGEPVPAAPPSGAPVIYREVIITAPADDETVRDNGGNLIVSISLAPALQVDAGHRLQLLLDGAVHETGTSNNFALTELDRGTHTLQALVLDLNGETLTASALNTFQLHRTTVKQIKRLKAAEKKLEQLRAQ